MPIINLVSQPSSTNTVFDLNEAPNPGEGWGLDGVTVSYGPCIVPTVHSMEACVTDEVFDYANARPLLGVKTFDPFRLRAVLTCNPAQWVNDQRDFFNRISGAFRASAHIALAKAIWDGPGGLASMTAPATANPMSVTAAIGLLVHQISGTAGGSGGVIHMSPFLANAAVRRGVLYRRGQRLLTVVGDHLVVADGGYSGNGPGVANVATGDVQWIYGTSMVNYFLGGLEFAAGFDMAKYMNVHANRLIVPVEVEGVFWFDPCAHFGHPVDIKCEVACDSCP